MGGQPIGSVVALEDPVSLASVSVQILHITDNQQPGAMAGGILTGGVAQMVNLLGNLDRQRETSIDGIASTGIATGTMQTAMKFQTSDSTDNFAAGTRTFTPAAMSGNIGGVPWSIQANMPLSLDTGGNQEWVLVTSVTATTFTCVTAKAHNGTGTPFQITGFVYNQDRDASGENDFASGSGTSVAAGYEFNAGDPAGGNFDRERNLQAKSITVGTINAGGAQGSTSLTLAAAPAAAGVGSLQPGQKVLLYVNGQLPTAGQYETAIIALNYVQGSTTVPLASATRNNVTYNRIAWDSFADLGPQTSTFLPFGIGIEALALVDPVSGYNTQARQAPGAAGALLVSTDGAKATYRYCLLGIAPVATPTDWIEIIGSATKTGRVKRIVIRGLATTAGTLPCQLIRRSAVNTGGAVSAITATKLDVNDPTATMTVNQVTTQRTGLGTSAGLVDQDRLELALAGAAGEDTIFTFAQNSTKAAVLRGATDLLCINFNGAALPAGTALDLMIEVEEDNS